MIVFHFLMVSLEAQKFMISMKPKDLINKIEW